MSANTHANCDNAGKIVTCDRCGRTFVCTPWDDYYCADGSPDHYCEACLVGNVRIAYIDLEAPLDEPVYRVPAGAPGTVPTPVAPTEFVHSHRCDFSLSNPPADAECYCPAPGEGLTWCGHLQEVACECADYEGGAA